MHNYAIHLAIFFWPIYYTFTMYFKCPKLIETEIVYTDIKYLFKFKLDYNQQQST